MEAPVPGLYPNVAKAGGALLIKITPTSLPEVLIIEPDVFEDRRGFFMETYHRERYARMGFDRPFVQDNLSYSVKDTIRGLHYQYPKAQAKLIQVLRGELFDIAVDIRRGSPHFGRWTGVLLDGRSRRQVYIPEGFAHGFCVLSEVALFHYKTSDYYSPEVEGGILWSDPALAIDWPVEDPLLSERDRRLPCLTDVASDRLPRY